MICPNCTYPHMGDGPLPCPSCGWKKGTKTAAVREDLQPEPPIVAVKAPAPPAVKPPVAAVKEAAPTPKPDSPVVKETPPAAKPTAPAPKPDPKTAKKE